MVWFNEFDPLSILFLLLVTIPAFAYHEFAHAIVADRLGDPTPRSNGRITLNPAPHLDLIGLVTLVAFGFGWATTPVNPYRLRGNWRTSYALVAVAGPVANLIQAVIFGLPFHLANAGIIGALPSWLAQLLAVAVFFNLLLLTFNLMPIPPLDGFTIFMGLVPDEIALRLEPLRQYGFLILLLVIFGLGRIRPELSVWNWFLFPVMDFLSPLVSGLGFFNILVLAGIA